jgi:translation initiation factor 1A
MAGRGKKKSHKKRGGYRKKKRGGPPVPGQPIRVRLPREGEILGVVTGRMGGSRMQVMCNDGKERLCRIPGKMKKRIWVKESDVVAVRPWEVEGEKKADVVWRYGPIEASWLRRNGYLKV